MTLFLVLFQKIPGTSDPESDLEFGLGSDFEEGCLIDGPDSDGDTYESDGHYYRRCKVEMDFSLEFCDNKIQKNQVSFCSLYFIHFLKAS